MTVSRRRLFTIGGVMAAAGAVGTDNGVVRAGVDDDVNNFVGQQNQTYWDNQRPHHYDWSAPRDVMIQLYDATVPHLMNTWTVFSIPGYGPIDVAATKGFPIPATAQLTSPEYRKSGSNGAVALPQPEPNGLYTGDTLGTWILSVNDQGYIIPEYHEELVTCYPFKVDLVADPIILGRLRVQRTGFAVSSTTIAENGQ